MAEPGGAGRLHDEGFLVQAIGHFVDSRVGGDRYVVGEGATTGTIRAWTTYRVPACDWQVFLETIWRNESANRVGPVVNLLLATNTWGEEVYEVRSANILEFPGTSPFTCIVRRRCRTDLTCQESPIDFVDLAGTCPPPEDQEYRASASIGLPPPTLTLRARDSHGAATPWSFRVRALSGIVTAGVIFDQHSFHIDEDTHRLVSAFDLTLFNAEFWNADDGDAVTDVEDVTRLPAGIVRGTDGYYIAGDAELASRSVLRFRR